MSATFVFYDPTGRRWIRFRRAFGITGIVLVVLLVLFVLSVISNPQLPTLGLPAVQHLANFGEVPIITRGEKAAKAIPYRFRKPVVKYVRNGGNPISPTRTAAKPREDQPLVFGFYVNWDEASKVSLRLNLGPLTRLGPEWLVLKNGGGDVDDQSDEQVIQIARDDKLPIVVEINNYREGWQPGDLHRVLNSPNARDNMIDNIYSNILEHKFAGVNIDFEQLPAPDRDKLISFMEALRAKLAPAGLLLTEDVPTDDDATYDLKRLGQINDYIVPMVYDEHYQSSTPGPVASEDWFMKQLDELAKQVPPSKTVIGFGNYGYDWIIGSRKGGVEVSYGDVVAAAEANKVSVDWDAHEKNPVLRYKIGSDLHEIWFLDAVTALNHAQDVSDYGFRGVGLWRLGAEDPGMWTIFGAHAWPDENFNPVPLFRLTAQKSVQHYGEGEVLRITDWPHDGTRNVWRDKDGDFD